MPEPGASLGFVETSVFTRRIVALALEEPLRELQLHLLRDPEAGALDPGTGGLRKVRMGDPGRGKGKRRSEDSLLMAPLGVSGLHAARVFEG
jgi:hypothetical protein